MNIASSGDNLLPEALSLIEELNRRWNRFQPNWLKVLIGVNIAFFALSMLVSEELKSIVASPSTWGPNAPSLYLLGENNVYRILNGQWYRLFSACFLHGNLIHIGVNLYALWNIGPWANHILGGKRFLTLYLLSGLVGALASMIWRMLTIDHPLQVLGGSVGASGAVFGLLGFVLLVARRTPGAEGMARQLMFFLILNIWIGLSSSQIDNAGHFGGFAVGLLFAMSTTKARGNFMTGVLENKTTSLVIALVCAASLLAAPLYCYGSFGQKCRQLLTLQESVNLLSKPSSLDRRTLKDVLSDVREIEGTELPFSAGPLIQYAEFLLKNQGSPNHMVSPYDDVGVDTIVANYYQFCERYFATLGHAGFYRG